MSRIAVSDGNGGLYIRRTVVEKALIAIASVGATAFCSLIVYIGQQTYIKISDTADAMIRLEGRLEGLESRLEAVAQQGLDNEKSIEDHDKWAREQRDTLDDRLHKLEYQ